MEAGYKKLKIYQVAHELALEVHKMSLGLPKFEMYEEGSQIRRSSKSASSNIVEGYCLRRYKAEFIRYLFRSSASATETIEHLELLYKTGSLKDENTFKDLKNKYTDLTSMIFSFIKSVDDQHDTHMVVSEEMEKYDIKADGRY